MTHIKTLDLQKLPDLVTKRDRCTCLCVYNKYAPLLYNLILKRVQHPIDAEEILCQTFVVFYSKSFSCLSLENSIFLCLYEIVVDILKSKSIFIMFRSKEEKKIKMVFLKSLDN